MSYAVSVDLVTVFLVSALSVVVTLNVMYAIGERLGGASPRIFVNVYKGGRKARGARHIESSGKRGFISGLRSAVLGKGRRKEDKMESRHGRGGSNGDEARPGRMGYNYSEYTNSVSPSEVGVKLLEKDNELYPRHSKKPEYPEPSNHHFA